LRVRGHRHDRTAVAFPPMAKPESKVVKLLPGEEADKAVLDALAAEGWELKTTLPQLGGGTQLVFQRSATSD
jgi:hypothetical protein